MHISTQWLGLEKEETVNYLELTVEIPYNTRKRLTTQQNSWKRGT
jgi:hypothetical protein